MTKKSCNFVNIRGLLIMSIIIGITYFLIKYFISTKFKEPLDDMTKNRLNDISGSKVVDFTGLDGNIKVTPLKGSTLSLPVDPMPTKPGCWYIYPNGCNVAWGDKKGTYEEPQTWKLDVWGVKNNKPASNSSSTACKTREAQLQKYCGNNKDIKTHFVSGASSIKPKPETDEKSTGKCNQTLTKAEIWKTWPNDYGVIWGKEFADNCVNYNETECKTKTTVGGVEFCKWVQ